MIWQCHNDLLYDFGILSMYYYPYIDIFLTASVVSKIVVIRLTIIVVNILWHNKHDERFHKCNK